MMDIGSSLVQQAIAGILEYMRQDPLKVGDDLPSEMHFAATLGVSRTVIREAYGALAALHIIDIQGGRRAKVGAISHGMVALSIDHAVRTEQLSRQQIWDVRRSLEQRAAGLAAIHRTEREANDIVGHAAAMRNSRGDRKLMAKHDIAMHQAISRASRNPLFAHLISSFELVMENTVSYLHRPSPEETELVIRQHEELARAIHARQPDEAEQAIAAHFDWSLRALVKSGFS